VEGRVAAFRISTWDTPFWVNPNRSGARYNKPGSGPTQYLCLHPLGPWAEYLRREDLRTKPEIEVVRQRMWVVLLTLRPPNEVFELTYETAAKIGLSPDDLVADDWSRCQEVAELLRQDPDFPKTWSVPSSALPGTQNVVIFGPRVAIPYQGQIIDPGLDMPCSVVAESTPPPEVLLSLTRFRGSPHAELENWKRDEPFLFAEPAFPAASPGSNE